ncbi:hypothetical protein EDD38_6501 [Kitasatospora cineracea]|uniref:Secreted protein n=1 Tax=Kitasatospora cineracea TaxID=88074 RepID=A0A3N4R9J2_9ACTN|nr:hypothetical protein EDD38_6501 [Kitasatospora cineracea]
MSSRTERAACSAAPAFAAAAAASTATVPSAEARAHPIAPPDGPYCQPSPSPPSLPVPPSPAISASRRSFPSLSLPRSG